MREPVQDLGAAPGDRGFAHPAGRYGMRPSERTLVGERAIGIASVMVLGVAALWQRLALHPAVGALLERLVRLPPAASGQIMRLMGRPCGKDRFGSLLLQRLAELDHVLPAALGLDARQGEPGSLLVLWTILQPRRVMPPRRRSQNPLMVSVPSSRLIDRA
jgi:hypothetical protein